MKTENFKAAVRALDKRYYVSEAAGGIDVYFNDVWISHIDKAEECQFSFDASRVGELPHLNSLLHGLIVNYALTPLSERKTCFIVAIVDAFLRYGIENVEIKDGDDK